MTLILNGTDGLSDVDGTAATPAIRGTDANTGIFFPAADTIAFSEGGAEVARFDSAGNLGIGTTSPNQKLAIASSAGVAASIEMAGNGNTLGTNSMFVGQGSAGDGYVWQRNSTQPLIFATNNTERMRINSSGQVIVGTTTGVNARYQVSADGAFITPYAAPSTAHFFSSNSADGNCVEIFQGRFNKAGLVLSANNTGTQTQIQFYEGGSAVGSVTTTTSSTAYNTSSDYRLKENIAPMTGALDTVAQLKPVTYNWKADGARGQGFIAHELAEVVPDCVVGEKDAVETIDDLDADGKKIGTKEVPKYQGIDTSFLVATLTAAIQELKATVDAQAARITALESAKA
jgi:hypothetical protein